MDIPKVKLLYFCVSCQWDLTLISCQILARWQNRNIFNWRVQRLFLFSLFHVPPSECWDVTVSLP